jgi:hypothetical protein
MLRELVDLGTGGWIGWSRDSFWDAMIVRSAGEIGCTVLYSEDLDTGQDYSGSAWSCGRPQGQPAGDGGTVL